MFSRPQFLGAASLYVGCPEGAPRQETDLYQEIVFYVILRELNRQHNFLRRLTKENLESKKVVASI